LGFFLGLAQPVVKCPTAGRGEVIRKLAAVATIVRRRHQTVSLQSLERAVDLADVDLPSAAEQGLEASLDLISVQRLLRKETQDPESK
jgi:hypothetical protein